MSSTTLPYGIERPRIIVTPRVAPLPPTVRPCVTPSPARVDHAAHVEPAEHGPPLTHLAAWCVAGSFGWAALIGGGWMAVAVLRALVF